MECGSPSFGRGMWTLDERAGVQIPRQHSNQAGGVRGKRTRLREPVHKDHRRRHQDRSDDAGNGGHASERAPHPEQRQNHKLKSDARGDSRDHANTTVHRQSTDANAARSESEDQRQGQRQRQGSLGQRQGQGCKERIVQESKEGRSEKVLLLPKDGPREGRVQKATERLGRCRGETDGSVATRRSSDRAVAVRTPRRETNVNACHSHALCEQRNAWRVFQ